MKNNIVIMGLMLAATLVILGGYLALKILLPSLFYQKGVVLAKDVIITSEQSEITGNNLLKVTKEQQLIALVLESTYKADPPHGIQSSEGELVIVEIKLIDEKGNEFPLNFKSSLSPSRDGDEVAEFGYLKGYNTLPTGKVFEKVVLRSNTTIKVKSILWSGYDAKDRK